MFVAAHSFLLGLNNSTEQDRNENRYWKPSKIFSASEFMTLRGEPLSTTLLNQHKLWILNTCSYIHSCVILTDHKENFSMKQTKTFTKNNTNQNSEI